LITSPVETYGRLDCALNNAGIVCTMLPTADCPFEEWDAIITTNLRGGWLWMKFEIRQMPGSGASVNNLLAALFGIRNLPIYTASKHGAVANRATEEGRERPAPRGAREARSVWCAYVVGLAVM